jgi:AbrB family looped-hinge helix DNA binding protein
MFSHAEKCHVEVTIAVHGRILIPKPVRDRLGPGPNAALELTVEPADGREALRLRPSRGRPALVHKDGVLVHTGMASEALDPVGSVALGPR